jgi:hypothetical protein
MSLVDFMEEVPNALLPPLDRSDVPPWALDLEQWHWSAEGYLRLPKFLPENLIDAYVAVRQAHGEYQTPTPYMQVPEIRDLCLYQPLMAKLEKLIGEPMAMHLNLTGWVSTERNWHQDDYLNPPFVNGHYAAVWFALDDISPDSGPFEYVPGSHKWPLIRREKVLAHLSPEEASKDSWPKASERLLTPQIEEEIRMSALPIKQFIPNKGDVLIWHARLMHRGSTPKIPGTERRAIITHYSAIAKRLDMPVVANHKEQGSYFVL